ncbi:MAG TPA: hypothetical protein VFD64_14140 [Gemmatimonadaceae bacterium]|nr:hypothetical protein [Gemmatimonadaceae bacterium]
MDRRQFLEILASSFAGARLGLATGAPGDFRAWVWFHASRPNDSAYWRRRFRELRDAGITGALVEGSNAGTKVIADAAHGAGIEFHRWIFTNYRFFDGYAKREHPEWFSVSRNGDSSLTRPPYVPQYNWFCPTREPVRQYLRGIVDGIAKRPEVDGVHLDYIRFIDVILPRGLWSRYNIVQDREYAQYDFCYCQVCVDKFKRQSGIDPRQLKDPSENVAWREFRWNAITEMVTLLGQAARAHNKKITAAVFATPTLARQFVRQAWDTWPVDAVFPMLYHNFYAQDVEWIGRGAREGVNALQGRVPLYAGLFLPRLDPAELARAVSLTREAGASGVALFSLNTLNASRLSAFARVIRSGDAPLSRSRFSTGLAG